MIDLTWKADRFQSDLVVLCDAYLLIVVKSHVNQYQHNLGNKLMSSMFRFIHVRIHSVQKLVSW